MKYLKSLLIGLLCLVVTLPIVYTNNVYAAYVESTLSLNLKSFSQKTPGSSSSTGSTALVDLSSIEIASVDLSTSVVINKYNEFWSQASATFYVTDASGKRLKECSAVKNGSRDTVSIDCTGLSGYGYFKVDYYASAKIYSDGSSAVGTATSSDVTIYRSHTHSYTPSVTTKATCTTAGKTTWKCSCGASYTTPIPATGHTFQTLTINGQKAAEKCIKCGFLGSGNLTLVDLSFNLFAIITLLRYSKTLFIH